MPLDRHKSVRVVRGSLRSHSSSSNSSSDPREKVKDLCRKLVAFMFTQVGVGGLVVSYAILGALAFMNIEKQADAEDFSHGRVMSMRSDCVSKLWNVTDHLNVLHKERWYRDVRVVLIDYQEKLAKEVKAGYDGRTSSERWTLPSALMFSLSVFTMIGFGHLVPRTDWGKIAAILYAVVGIPVYVLYFLNMGEVLASCFKWVYCKVVSCSRGASKRGSNIETAPKLDEGDEAGRIIVVPTTACLWVMFLYLLAGTVMFAEWERWGYLDACYFCVTSLCKIGFGDFVPGANAQAAGSQTKLIINFVYLLIGMGVIAMCYNLMKEEVLLKLRELRSDIVDKCQDVTHHIRR